MKKITFFSIIGVFAIVSGLSFVAAVVTDNQYKWLDTMVVISFIVTLISMPFLMLISFILNKRKK